MQLKGQSSRHLEVGGVDGLVLVCVKFSAVEALNFRKCLGSKKLGYNCLFLKAHFSCLQHQTVTSIGCFFVLFFFKIMLLL